MRPGFLFSLSGRAYVEQQLASEDARRFALEAGDSPDAAEAKAQAAGRAAFDRVARETWASERAAAADRSAKRAEAERR